MKSLIKDGHNALGKGNKSDGQNALSMSNGFTIIETLLFLAITGLMVVGVLFGASRSINYQRYKDSVISLQSIIQQQYSDVTNTINSHDDTWDCNSAGLTSQPVSPTGLIRGQSNCVILGKFVRTTGTDSKTILINDVIGYTPAAPIAGLNDINVFIKDNISLPDGYGVYVSKVDPKSYEVSWGASLTDIHGVPLQFSMLVVRSPLTGIIKTFFKDSFVSDADVRTIVDATSVQKGHICVNSNDLFSGTKMAIIIAANSPSASGVETLGDTSGCS